MPGMPKGGMGLKRDLPYSVRVEYVAANMDDALNLRDVIRLAVAESLVPVLKVDTPARIIAPEPGPEADYGTQPPEVP